jgi:hypothetical protein
MLEAADAVIASTLMRWFCVPGVSELHSAVI